MQTVQASLAGGVGWRRVEMELEGQTPSTVGKGLANKWQREDVTQDF